MASTVGDMMLNHPAVRDLTGQVIKTEYIAHGGNSDVWKGKWKDDYGEVFEVRTALYSKFNVQNLSLCR
jgi:hypothetical protein